MDGLTRRRLLAVAGVTALGCCGGFGAGGEAEPTPLDATAVATAVSGSLPTVTEPFPVLVAASHFADSQRAVRSTLGELPDPVPSTGPPDETTRATVRRSVERARENLSAADDAETARERLGELGDARSSAERAASTWAFATDELTRGAVRSRALTLERRVDAFREDRPLVGDPADPVRALLVHSIVGSLAERAGDDATPEWDDYEPASSDAPTAADAEAEQLPDARAVGKRAGAIAEGRARLADARQVDERFTGSLTDPSSLEATFVDARDGLTETLRSGVAEFPGPDADAAELVGTDTEGAGRAVESALRQLHADAHYFADREATADPASDVLARYHGLATADAFETLRDRVSQGDELGVDSAADLRERRDEAVDAVETALAESEERRLARDLLAYPVARMATTDASLREWDQVTLQQAAVGDRARYYIEFAALARATPEAVDETLVELGAF
ncbi:hypothetical protein [Halosimplex pelagicum]|uniref:Uncharacterized protein n=1 Tax=Halosimplex pelagicum TaxID=869886 RepID=A0A7D5TAJ0_9EURY|nr:hypothetical protein [Halosimplex pelagicum]QLH81533.1 hypothetical protein HZS54_07805 [Halosimplex pelagicum]